MIDWIWLILYFVIGLTLFGFLFFGLIFGAMYTRIPTKKLEKAIKLGELSIEKEVYDLGAGLGTISFEAAYSGAHITAVEIDPIKIACMRFLLIYNNKVAKASMTMTPMTLAPGMKKVSHLDVTIVKANLLKVDLSKADIVYCYLSPVLMPKVADKASKEMKKGSKLISIEWPIKTWQPTYEDSKEKIYVYEIN